MKLLSFLFFLLLCQAGFLSAQTKLPEESDPVIIKDGVMLVSNRASDYYAGLADFQITGAKKKAYREGLSQITKPNGHALKKHARLGLAQNWVQMVPYNGGYYPYYHENIGDERVQINDSTIVDYFLDGPMPLKVTCIKKISTDHYEMEWWFDETTWKLDIYIIDRKNQIAVFDYGEEESTYRYNLMIASEKVKDFPIIVSYIHGFKGDTCVDYKGLIQACGK